MKDEMKEAMSELLKDVLLDAWPHLDHFVQTDERFQELCHEYEECLAALRHWRSPEPVPRRIGEYAELLLGLEEEILRHVKDNYDIQSFDQNCPENGRV